MGTPWNRKTKSNGIILLPNHVTEILRTRLYREELSLFRCFRKSNLNHSISELISLSFLSFSGKVWCILNLFDVCFVKFAITKHVFIYCCYCCCWKGESYAWLKESFCEKSQQIGLYWVAISLCFKVRLNAKPLIRKYLFILFQIKIICYERFCT